MQNVVPSHLSDVNLFDFKGITHGSEVVDGGDLAFDREEIPCSLPAGSRKKMTPSWMSCV
jgi:tRNA 2-thiocytidine biosynthesis protein TtcA